MMLVVTISWVGATHFLKSAYTGIELDEVKQTAFVCL